MFPKGNLNRIWLVLGAIDALDSPTLVNITKEIHMPKSSVNDVLKRLLDGQVAGVRVEKVGAEYRIAEWLNLKREVKLIYKNNT